MSTTKVLVRRPARRLADGIVTNIERKPVDYDLAAKQWEQYVSALESAAWDVVEVPPAEDCPDSVFVEDAVVIFRNVAVLTSPGAPLETRRDPRCRACRLLARVLGQQDRAAGHP